MAWTTLANVKGYLPEKKIIQLTGDQKTGNVNLSIFNECVSLAENKVKGYLRGLFPIVDTIEDSAVPAQVVDVTTILTACFLWNRKLSATMPDSLRDNCKAATKTLEKMQDGTINPWPVAQEPDRSIANTRTRVYGTTFKTQYHTGMPC